MDGCSLCSPMFVLFDQSLYSFFHCHQLYQRGKYGRTDVGNRSRRAWELAASWFLVLSSQKNWINAAACCGDQLTHSVHGDSTQITALNTSANKPKTGDQRKENIITLSSKQIFLLLCKPNPLWIYLSLLWRKTSWHSFENAKASNNQKFPLSLRHEPNLRQKLCPPHVRFSEVSVLFCLVPTLFLLCTPCCVVAWKPVSIFFSACIRI